jgi:hypothetical protein
LPLAVRYHAVNAMLLNEVQKQQRSLAAAQARITELEAAAAAQLSRAGEQQRELARQQERIEALESALHALSRASRPQP